MLRIEANDGIKFKNVLDKEQLRLVKLYFYPQGKSREWLSQENVIKVLPGIKIWRIRDKLVESLMTIWGVVKED